MESMTGYAYLEKRALQFSFSTELKSLNSRYLEVYTNLPDILRNDENNLLSLLKDRFSRGKIELSIKIFDWKNENVPSINIEILKKYYEQLKRIERDLKIDNHITIDALLRLDNVIKRERVILSDESRREIFNSVDMVIKKVRQMRMKESNAIKKDLQRSLSIISESLREIKTLSKDISKTTYKKLKTNLESLTQSQINDMRLYSEVAILADKLDINEEIVRLNDHLKKFKSIMNGKGDLGKRLDFLAQEMFREINTISSKSNSSKVSHLVVEVKNHIDRLREHCRNMV